MAAAVLPKTISLQAPATTLLIKRPRPRTVPPINFWQAWQCVLKYAYMKYVCGKLQDGDMFCMALACKHFRDYLMGPSKMRPVNLRALTSRVNNEIAPAMLAANHERKFRFCINFNGVVRSPSKPGSLEPCQCAFQSHEFGVIENMLWSQRVTNARVGSPCHRSLRSPACSIFTTWALARQNTCRVGPPPCARSGTRASSSCWRRQRHRRRA